MRQHSYQNALLCPFIGGGDGLTGLRYRVLKASVLCPQARRRRWSFEHICTLLRKLVNYGVRPKKQGSNLFWRASLTGGDFRKDTFHLPTSFLQPFPHTLFLLQKDSLVQGITFLYHLFFWDLNQNPGNFAWHSGWNVFSMSLPAQQWAARW